MLQLVRNKKRRYVFWAQILAVAVVLFPLSLHTLDFRSAFSRGLAISAYKSSPAYAAFEDLTEDYDSYDALFPENAVPLKAGERFDFQQAIVSLPTIRQVSLQGVTIRKSLNEPKAFYVAGESVQRGRSGIRGPSDLNIYDINGRLLPLQSRKQELVAAYKDDDWAVPTVTTEAQKLIAQHTLPPNSSSPTPAQMLVQNEGITIHKVDAAPEPSMDRPFWLSGQVEMTQGLAFVGPETQITVKRVHNGNTYEAGKLWVSEGRFEIHVKEPQGFLVAELKSRHTGRVLGQGEISLMNVPKPSKNETRIAGLKIELRPTVEGASFRPTSGYSYGDHTVAVTDARVEVQSYSEPQPMNEDGMVSDNSFTQDSSMVARATAKGHWPSIVIGQASEPREIRVFSNKMITALIGLSAAGHERKEAEQLGVVWGRVMRRGKSVEGISVEMAGDYKPIYFADYNGISIPDMKLVSTSKNGLFAFIRVPNGVQALRISSDKGGQWIPAQVFATEDKHVSYVELEMRDRVLAQLKVFDAFNLQKPVQARVHLVGVQDRLQVDSSDYIEFSIAANPYLIEAEPDLEYHVSRTTVPGSSHMVHMPLIPRQWINSLMITKGITQMADRGVVVGFMDSAVSEIELTGYANGENMQIYHFDAHGNVLDPKVQAVAGGGFIIFNAPLGLQTLYVRSHQSHENFAQVVAPEPDVIQVVTH